MGVIRKINELELVGGKENRDVYPVTSTMAVVDENGIPLNKILDKIKSGEEEGVDKPISSRTIIAFTSTSKNSNPDLPPETPISGSWDMVTNQITLPRGWSIKDTLEPPVWMSSGEFLAISPDKPTWTPPVRVSGADGTDGADGSTLEFIFYKCKANAIPNKPSNNPNVTGYVPIQEGWTDSPQGVSLDFQTEYVCTRTKNKDTGKWNDWYPVGETAKDFAVWAKWGADGKDGDGVEYIYFINGGQALKNPTPRTGNSWNLNAEGYQSKDTEYIPTTEDGTWLDNPPEISANKDRNTIWVSIRKYRKGPKDPNTGLPIKEYEDKTVWGPFSNPVVWSKYSEDGKSGISIRTIYIAKPFGETPVVPESPNLIGEWSFTRPIDFNGDEKALWQSQAYVTFDNLFAEVSGVEKGWQEPIIVSGINGKDSQPRNYKTTVFKLDNEASLSNPPKAPSNGIKVDQIPINGWLDFPSAETGQWWQCIGDVSGKDNTITWGNVKPLNGTDGKAQDGKHWEIRLAAGKEKIAPRFSKGTTNPNEGLSSAIWIKITSITPPPTLTEENPRMWEIMAEFNADGTVVSGWSDPFPVSGERGPQGKEGPASKVPGPSGVPGVDFEVQYCKGSETLANENWQNNIPSILNKDEYIWCRQGRKSYSRVEDSDRFNSTISWGEPFRLQGANGLPGNNGNSVVMIDSGIFKPRAEWEDYIKNPTLSKNKIFGIPIGTKINVGDIAVLVGKVTDQNYISAHLYGKTTLVSSDIIYIEPINVVFGGTDGKDGSGLKLVEFNDLGKDWTKKTRKEWNTLVEGKNSFTITNIKNISFILTGDIVLIEGYITDEYDQKCSLIAEVVTAGDSSISCKAVNFITTGGYIKTFTTKKSYSESDCLRYCNSSDTTWYINTEIEGLENGFPPAWDKGNTIILIIPCTNGDTYISYQTSLGLYNGDESKRILKPQTYWVNKKGKDGNKGQMIYPMGLYSEKATYVMDEYKTPYVFDTSSGKYYVYNSYSPWVNGREPGTSDGDPITPSISYSNRPNTFWAEFNSFDAMFTKIGIIKHGLIGSAVFYNDYMISQQGTGNVLYNNEDYYWTTVYRNYSRERLLSMGWVEKFPETSSSIYYIQYDGNKKEWSDPFPTSNPIVTSNYELFNPDEYNTYSEGSYFAPNICINFKTGECWFAGGNVHLNSDGSGSVGNEGLIFDTKGNLLLGQVYKNWKYITAHTNSAIRLPDGRNYAIQVPPSKNGSATIILPSDKSNDGVELKILLYPSEMKSGETTKINITIESRDENGNSKSNVWHSDGVNNFLFAKGAKFTVGGIYTFHSVIINDELHWIWTLG